MDSIDIFCDPASTQAKEIFAKSGCNIVDEFIAGKLLWIRKRYQDRLENVSRQQVINHIPGEKEITTKAKLTHNLKTRDQKYKPPKKALQTKSTDFYKESYLLFDTQDATDFFNNTRDRNKDIWIMKPSVLSRGCGVKIVEDLTDLKEVIINKSNPKYAERYKEYFYYEDEELDFIIQKHIDNPLLLNNKKSEIRVYWIVLSIEPLSVIFFNDSTVRLCTEDYDPNDYVNPLSNITNVFQQKKHSENLDSNALKWSLDMLVDSVLEQGLTNNKNFVYDDLMPKIRRAILYIIKSAQKSILKSKLYKKQKHLNSFNYFGLYGCDIMLDTNLDPWVLEIQKGPGLSYDHQHKAKVLLPMAKYGIENIFRYKFVDDSKFDLPDKYSWLIYKGKDEIS